jgi:hypothetical protein
VELVRAGRALLLAGAPVGAPHLWLVLTDPDPENGLVVMVMVVTSRPHTDKTVTLSPADHPFIHHESNVDFGSARFFPVSRLNAALKKGRCQLQADASARLLNTVRAGLLKSPRTIHAVADYCRTRFAE